MEVSTKELMARYAELDDDALIELKRQGTLTEAAQYVLDRELSIRKISISAVSEVEVTDNLEPHHKRPFVSRLKPGSEKRSRWWMVYHLWAGYCAKVYIDVSGLSKFIVGAPSGSGPASASIYATSSAMVVVAAVALGYFLSKSLVTIIDQSDIPRTGKIALKSVLPIGYFLVAAPLSAITGPLLAESASINKSSRPVAQQSSMKPVIAFTTTQSAEGVTEADLDQSGLKNLETWMAETMLQKGRKKFAEMDYNSKDFKPKVSASSVYINAYGKKLAVIKVNMGDSMRSVTIMGIEEDELLRVSCIRASDHDIPVWSGECGNEVRKTFKGKN